jgi:hypothetical protein
MVEYQRLGCLLSRRDRVEMMGMFVCYRSLLSLAEHAGMAEVRVGVSVLGQPVTV